MCLFDRNHQRNQRKYRKSTIKVDLNSKITTSIAQAEENERENDDFFNRIVELRTVTEIDRLLVL